jgi:hypothetical protein
MQHARHGDVVEVVAGARGHRAILAPARHAADHQARVALQADLRCEPQALDDAGAKRVEQHVGALGQLQHEGDRVGPLEVHGDRLAVAQHQRIFQFAFRAEIGRLRAIHPQHGGAEIGQQHRAQRRRPDAGQLEDAYTVQRPRALPWNCVRRHSGWMPASLT